MEKGITGNWRSCPPPGDRQALRLMVIGMLIFAAFSLLLPGTFCTLRNLQSMLVQLPEFGILAFGILLTMLASGIDLSIVGAANLSAIVAALILTHMPANSPERLSAAVLLSTLGALAAGSLCGLLNGILVSVVGITPILATLGTGSLYTGLSLVITGGPAITTTQLAFLGNDKWLGVPLPFIVFLAIAILGSVMLNRSVFGFQLYLLGANATAARFSGISPRRVLIRVYWLSGLIAGIAGLIFLARTNSAKPDYGSSFLLLSVLIVVLGGVRTTGGFGTVSGVVAAVLSIQFLSTGLNLLMLQWFPSSAAIFFRQFAWGGLLLAVMVFNSWRNQDAGRIRGKRRLSHAATFEKTK